MLNGIAGRDENLGLCENRTCLRNNLVTALWAEIKVRGKGWDFSRKQCFAWLGWQFSVGTYFEIRYSTVFADSFQQIVRIYLVKSSVNKCLEYRFLKKPYTFTYLIYFI